LYAGLLGDELRRVVLTDHGFMHYFVQDQGTLWSGTWAMNTGMFDAVRETGNASIRAAIKSVRDLGNANVFVGIETDMMRDGRLTHDPEFTEEFDVILCSIHFLPWLDKVESEEERVKGWLDHVDALLDKPEADVFAHPFRWIGQANKGHVPGDAMDRVLRWVEERGVTLELNSTEAVPEAAAVRMLRVAADRGLPVVVGTDAHKRAQVTNFSVARRRLALAGLTTKNLYMPEVEDFIARKGRRNTAASRPSKAGSVKRSA